MAQHGLLDNALIVDELCDRLTGGEGLTEICRDDHMPSDDTVYRRMARDPDFAERIARARQAQQEAVPEKIVQMALEATSENWQVVKLRIHAYQWRAAKLAPKKYGDKILHGDDPDNPLPKGFSVNLVKADAAS
ncbi:terminase small subunit-like protein [Aurantiacibacter spongiae]|uniref:Uncharacterized protein n=1 Tax=Aurantiacibacter spongiae TaxID=2488860 RepID=A0A3N5DIJ6_9SPHN|nr:hypothetical protein [Aurantiacibacter spongiae]RPF70455.1 hypothetical protein EG799_01530 [Aurantiacibacter spongiae]